MDQSITTYATSATAHEWTETNQFNDSSNDGYENAIRALTRLLDRINESSHPNEYCCALRKRAQYFSLSMKFDDALEDLHRELEISSSNNYYRRTGEVEDLISRLTQWRNALM